MIVSTHFPHSTCVLVNKYFSFLLLFRTLHVDFIALILWIIEVLVKGYSTRLEPIPYCRTARGGRFWKGTREPRARALCKIGYRWCVLWCNEQVTCIQKSQEHLNRVVPFHCGILLEESGHTRGGKLSSILRRRESKRRTMSKPNSAEMPKIKPKRKHSATIFGYFL